MKTANVKWGRGKREATGKKVNLGDEFVRPTWIDLSFPGNGARNTSATATKDLPTAPEIGVLTARGILLLQLHLKGLPRKICKGFPPWPWSLALVFPRSGKGDVA